MSICPYCGKFGAFDFNFGPRSFYQCDACALMYNANPPDAPSLLSSYSELYFSRYARDQLQGGRNKLFDHILSNMEFQWSKSFVTRKTLLDVGTGCGFFLAAARTRGWNVMGVDPSYRSIEIARRRLGLNVIQGTLSDIPKTSSWDAISFINVLEHTVCPWKEMAHTHRLLKPGGLVVIRVPNGRAHSAVQRTAHQLGISHLSQKFVVFHQYSFTPKFLHRLLSDHGFTEISIINSPLSRGDPNHLFKAAFIADNFKAALHQLSNFIEHASGGRAIWGPSLLVMAKKA